MLLLAVHCKSVYKPWLAFMRWMVCFFIDLVFWLFLLLKNAINLRKKMFFSFFFHYLCGIDSCWFEISLFFKKKNSLIVYDLYIIIFPILNLFQNDWLINFLFITEIINTDISQEKDLRYYISNWVQII